MRLRLHPYRLPLKRPWVAAGAVLSERRGWLVEARPNAASPILDHSRSLKRREQRSAGQAFRADDGTAGWGDCAPLPSLGGPREAQMRWAIETALIDLEARRRGLPLAVLLGARTLAVPVNAALGPLDDGCAARAATAAAEGYTTAKLKVGLAPVEEELSRLRDVAAAALLRLRLDANRAWDHADARRFLTAIADLPIDGVEEPLAEPCVASLAALQAALPYPLAADESLPVLGLDALLAWRAVRRLVLKPARLGGVLRTLSFARTAQAAGLEVVITSVVDSAIGVAAAAHLAAAIAPTIAHGLATSSWLAADVATPPVIEKGRLRLPASAGLGVIPAALPVGG